MMTTRTRNPQNPRNTQRRIGLLRVLRSPRFLCFVCIVVLSLGSTAPHAQPVFRSGTELVLVNVVVRDKSGAVVRGLTRDDFTVAEDDKPQTITSFDFEELSPAGADAAPPAAAEAPAQTVLAKPAAPSAAPAPAPKVDMHGRRLIVLFFDLSSMQPEELQRAVAAAHDYVDQKLSPADLIAVVSFSSSLNVDQDFTADRETLAAAIDAYGGAGAQGLDAGAAADQTRPTTARRSRPTTPSSTSSTPTGDSMRCRRWPASSRASSRRSR
jgi:VWFA-related protein